MAKPKPDLQFDPATLPLNSIFQQALDPSLDRASPAWTLLGSVSRERPEAGVLLIGLMQVHHGDLARMLVLIRAVAMVRTVAAVQALNSEFLSTPSTPTTRAYLTELFKILTTQPRGIALPVLRSLAEDKRVGVRWRKRFHDVVERLAG